MSKPIMQNVKLPSIDELFSGGATTIETNQEGLVQMLPIAELHSFPNHPFLVQNDSKMKETIESIRDKGVLVPILVRTREAGGYEIISGHRRTFACRQLGMKTIPALIHEMNDDEATIIMVDANIQREKILPSEKAKAYAMKYEALKHRGKAGGITIEDMEKEATDNAKTIQRYISLAKLEDGLLSMLDNGALGLSQAYSVALLSEEEQKWLKDELTETDARLSVSQADGLRKMSRLGQLTREDIAETLSQSKKQKCRVVLTESTLKKYFSDSVDNRYMEKVILELLAQWKESAKHE